jgi:hypothetical protein
MKTISTQNLTPKSFRHHAERVFRASNPAAVASGVVIKWERCERVQWFDQSQGFSGTMLIVAPGFRSRRMIATSHPSGISVR